MAIVGPDGTPLGGIGGEAETPLKIEYSQQDGSVRLVHTGTGAFLAFLGDGTILLRDAYGNGLQSNQHGDLMVAALNNVVNYGANIAFRGQQPDQIGWAFTPIEPKEDSKNGQSDDGMVESEYLESRIINPTNPTSE